MTPPAPATADVARPVLLTVSGTIPDDLAVDVGRGVRPRADYTVLAEAFDADLLDLPAARRAAGPVGRVLERLGGAGLIIAWACFRLRRRYEVVVTDGEQVGLPFAALCRLGGRQGVRHVMIVHVLSVAKKTLLVRALRLTGIIDRFVVYCTAQRDHVRRLGARPDQLVLTPFMVDVDFFAPDAVAADRRRMICSAGLERRDYQTLMDAVDGLDVDVIIAAASPWSKWSDSSTGRQPPSNVEIRRLGFADLRQLYADCAFVVMPLMDVDFQAGITTILEAMAMQRAVVCTRTRGQVDTIEHDRTGSYVAAGDPAALRAAITSLLEDPQRAERLGRDARSWTKAHADIDVYAARLGAHISSLRTAGR